MSEKKTILVIDDETQIVETLKDLLTDSGYEVETASNGLEGLEKLSKITPHLILLDMNMPKMSGIAMFRKIYDPAAQKTPCPVLIMTAREQLKELFTEFNIDGFITKPFKIDELLLEIDTIISKRYGIPSKVPFQDGMPLRKILIVRDHDNIFDTISSAFAQRGYEVNMAITGVAGIERAMTILPDLILIQLELPDLTGDVVALKLKMIAKTMDIPLIIYSPKPKAIDYAGAGRIYQKLDIKLVTGSDNPLELVTQSDSLLQQKKAA